MSDMLHVAWEQFADAIVRMGKLVDETTRGCEPVDRAEGYRFVARILGAMLDSCIEQDPHFPALSPIMTPTRKFFVDNPDTLYYRASLDPNCRYRISGNRGTCEYLSFCAYGHTSGHTYIVANISDRELKFDEDGGFELILSSDKPRGAANWMTLDANARILVARQYFLNRKTERPAELRIEALNVQAAPPPLNPMEMTKRLRLLTASLDRMVSSTIEAMKTWSKQPNTVSIHGGADSLLNLYPMPDNQYVGGWYQLRVEEALVIEGTPPDCRYWSLQLSNRWLESLDYRYHRVSLNKNQITLEPDGRFKILVAHRDPGTANWLDTCGHHEGVVVFRWLQAEAAPSPPVFRVVRLDGA